MPLAIKVLFVVVALFIGFLGFRLVQFGVYLKHNPTPKAPGEAEFREANRKIISNRGTTVFGNTPGAVGLAADYSESLKLLRDSFFTEGNQEALSISKGEFLTYCQRNSNSCVFLVHVPELRRFTRDAKDSLVELAWQNAQFTIKNAATPPPETVVVGVKGAMLYEAILIGDFVPELNQETTSIRMRGSGVEGLKLLYPFFAPPVDLDSKTNDAPPSTALERSPAPE